MASPPQPRYDIEEVARRGDEIYDHVVLPRLRQEDDGKLVLIDMRRETGRWTRTKSPLRIVYSPESQMRRSGCGRSAPGTHTVPGA